MFNCHVEGESGWMVRVYFPTGTERVLHGRGKRESGSDSSVYATGRPGGSEFPGRYDRDYGS